MFVCVCLLCLSPLSSNGGDGDIHCMCVCVFHLSPLSSHDGGDGDINCVCVCVRLMCFSLPLSSNDDGGGGGFNCLCVCGGEIRRGKALQKFWREMWVGGKGDEKSVSLALI